MKQEGAVRFEIKEQVGTCVGSIQSLRLYKGQKPNESLNTSMHPIVGTDDVHEVATIFFMRENFEGS